MRTASRLSGPMARAHRNATVAESTPPDRPSTIRSKPVWAIWARMKPTMTSTACAGSMAGSGVRSGSVMAGSSAGAGRPARSAMIRSSSRRVELEPLVGQERQAVALHAQVIGLERPDHERLLPQRRLDHDRAVGGQQPRATPEGQALLVADAVAERDRHRAEQRVGVLHLVPAGDRDEPRLAARRARRSGGHVDEEAGPVVGLEHRDRRMPEVLAYRQADAPDRRPRRRPSGSDRPRS